MIYSGSFMPFLLLYSEFDFYKTRLWDVWLCSVYFTAFAIGSNSYEKVKTFKYLGSLSTNQNYIQEEIKCRLKAGNSCYNSVQTLLSSRLLSKNLKIKIYKTIIILLH